MWAAESGRQKTQSKGYFAGSRISAVNITRDGFSVSSGRYDQGTFATSYASSDLVEEIKVQTATVDAEATRGSGQVAMVTRSGTNHLSKDPYSGTTATRCSMPIAGSTISITHRPIGRTGINSAAVLGGPIVKNKTFFFVLIDEQRFVDKENFVGTVLRIRRGKEYFGSSQVSMPGTPSS